MTKTFIANAITFIGTELTILVAGVIVGMVFGWEPTTTANLVMAAQAAYAGFWFASR